MKKILAVVSVMLGFAVFAAPGDDYTGVLLWPYEELCEMDGLALPLVGMEVNRLNGWSIAGLWTRANEAEGLLISGIGTKVENRCDGALIALGAVGCGDMYGAEISLFSDGGVLHGCDITLASSEHTEVYGTQIGLLFNRADTLEGFQLAALNMTDTFSGLQLGVMNVANKSEQGWQIGAINAVGEDMRGVQIGLINVCPQTLCLPIINCRF